jgi:GNAT superfamily N-acetyltransferase
MMGVAEDDVPSLSFLQRRGYRLSPREGQEITMLAELGHRQEPPRPPLDRLGLKEVRVSDRQPWQGPIGWYPPGAPDGYAHRFFGDYQHEVMALVRGDTITSHLEWYPMRQARRVALLDYQIAPDDRGQGLGSYLLDKFLWLMTQRGYQTVELHTHTVKNNLAYRMYLRRGFGVVAKWVTLEKKPGSPA